MSVNNNKKSQPRWLTFFYNYLILLLNMVGARGFEPPTSWSQTKRATRLRYAPTDGIGTMEKLKIQSFFAS